MSRKEWISLARALATKRERLRAERPVIVCSASRMRYAVWAQRLAAMDDTVTTVACVLRSRSSRFDEDRFLKIVGVGRT